MSLARASAIANYIAARGIARERLIIIGAGSSAPIADNTTGYDRRLNRRISVLLHDSVDAEQTPRDVYSAAGLFESVSFTSSISNSNVAFGGTGGLPRAP